MSRDNCPRSNTRGEELRIEAGKLSHYFLSSSKRDNNLCCLSRKGWDRERPSFSSVSCVSNLTPFCLTLKGDADRLEVGVRVKPRHR